MSVPYRFDQLTWRGGIAMPASRISGHSVGGNYDNHDSSSDEQSTSRAGSSRNSRQTSTLTEHLQPARQRVPTSAGGVRPNRHDVGRDFHLNLSPGSGHDVGRYIGPSQNDGRHVFQVGGRQVEVAESHIHGYRPTVGLMHPPGQMRRPEDNLRGRDQVYLSEGDLSAAVARQRRDPSLANRMAVTTYETDENRPHYAQYRQNERDLAALGVPILHGVDLSQAEAAQRLSQVPPNSNLHFQMPRVPQGTPGYSTQRLVNDTLRMPERMGRHDVSVSITTPHPNVYPQPSTHNRIYGLESGNAVRGTNMQRYASGSDSEGDLEEYGYGHRRTTVDESTGAAERRKKYKFERSE
ncbi:hypothetical protein [Burkholderia ubonensis]|uniref:hypothetical protein n=1 Tax=Burkholderia ubonensis TaxID=101571 RepID=UPI0012F907CF|nr:hypothetical protein [Burkholderia ubonensis]